MSDRITWECCPRCGDVAAAGWDGAELSEFDCSRGCELGGEEWRQLVQRETADPPV